MLFVVVDLMDGYISDVRLLVEITYYRIAYYIGTILFFIYE